MSAYRNFLAPEYGGGSPAPEKEVAVAATKCFDFVTRVAASGKVGVTNPAVDTQILGRAVTAQANANGDVQVVKGYPGVRFEIPQKAGTTWADSLKGKLVALAGATGAFTCDLDTLNGNDFLKVINRVETPSGSGNYAIVCELNRAKVQTEIEVA